MKHIVLYELFFIELAFYLSWVIPLRLYHNHEFFQLLASSSEHSKIRGSFL